jgi:hypothetical protein
MNPLVSLDTAMVAMSDADAERLRKERLKAKREAHTNQRHKALRMESTVPIVPVPEVIRMKQLMLSIQLQASTIEKLREVSWLIDKTGNDNTWDQVVCFLVRSFYENRVEKRQKWTKLHNIKQVILSLLLHNAICYY